MEQREATISWTTLNREKWPVIKHEPFGPPSKYNAWPSCGPNYSWDMAGSLNTILEFRQEMEQAPLAQLPLVKNKPNLSNPQRESRKKERCLNKE